MKKKEIDGTHRFNTESGASHASNSMVDIVVRMKQDDTFANLKVSSFDLILSLEFLLKIAQFVTVPDDGKPTIAPPIASTTSAVTKRKSHKNHKVENLNISKNTICQLFNAITAAEMVPATETDPNKKITVLINIEQPDIILVEAMDDINCLALILNVSALDALL